MAHHGIKGQKWGVRRYQNDDGSLTQEGRKRYLADSERAANENRRDLAQAKEIARMAKTGDLKSEDPQVNELVKAARKAGMSDSDIRASLNITVSKMDSLVEATKKARDYERKMQKYVRDNAHVTLRDIQQYSRELSKEMNGDRRFLDDYQAARWKRITSDD